MSRARIDPVALALHWNTAYPVGVEVDVRDGEGITRRARTTSPAWLSDGEAVVSIEGGIAVPLARCAAVMTAIL